MLYLLMSLVASAADLDGDGCEDSYFTANSACVAPSATLASGVTVGARAKVNPYASVGPNTHLDDDTVVATRATVVGAPGASAPPPHPCRNGHRTQRVDRAES